MFPRMLWTFVLLCLALTAVRVAAEPAPTLRLADAQVIAARAHAQARKLGRDISIVIVNREGRVILSQRMDAASFLSLAVAEGKASTAAAIGVPTAVLEKGVDSGHPSILSAPGAVVIAGGLPVRSGGALVGGVGVSGGAPQEDEAIVQAALGSPDP